MANAEWQVERSSGVMGSRIVDGRGLCHRRRAALAATVGVLALVVGLATAWQVITQWRNESEDSPPPEITVGKGNIDAKVGNTRTQVGG